MATILLGTAARAQELPPTPTPVPLLWRVEPLDQNQKPSYLFGTIHLGDRRATSLAPQVTDAILASDVVWTEYQEPENSDQLIAESTFLPDGQSLMELVGEDYAATIRDLLAETGMESMGPFLDRMQPIPASVILGSIERPELLGEDGVDDVVEDLGIENDKEIGGVETLEEQIAVLTSVDLDAAVRMFKRSVDDLSSSRRSGEGETEQLIVSYLRGDEEQQLAETLVGLSPEDPELVPFVDALVWNRNRIMANRTADWIRANEDRSLFLAVGAAHLGGEGGVISLLEKKGFTLTRIPDEKTRAQLRVEWARWDLQVAEIELERLSRNSSGR